MARSWSVGSSSSTSFYISFLELSEVNYNRTLKVTFLYDNGRNENLVTKTRSFSMPKNEDPNKWYTINQLIPGTTFYVSFEIWGKPEYGEYQLLWDDNGRTKNVTTSGTRVSIIEPFMDPSSPAQLYRGTTELRLECSLIGTLSQYDDSNGTIYWKKCTTRQWDWDNSTNFVSTGANTGIISYNWEVPSDTATQSFYLFGVYYGTGGKADYYSEPQYFGQVIIHAWEYDIEVCPDYSIQPSKIKVMTTQEKEDDTVPGYNITVRWNYTGILDDAGTWYLHKTTRPVAPSSWSAANNFAEITQENAEPPGVDYPLCVVPNVKSDTLLIWYIWCEYYGATHNYRTAPVLLGTLEVVDKLPHITYICCPPKNGSGNLGWRLCTPYICINGHWVEVTENICINQQWHP